MANNLRIPAFLMALAILVIIIFQGYWLRKNYREEQRLFKLHSNILFRETLFRLQASKLHLDSSVKIRVSDKQGVMGITQILQRKMLDSNLTGRQMKSTMIITASVNDHERDSNHTQGNLLFRRSPNALDFLTGVDSLQDSISIKEITNNYTLVLAKEKINLPFSVKVSNVLHGDSSVNEMEIDDSKVVMGFSKPKLYELTIEDSSWYIIRRMWQPILVSVLLVGITLASFLLLYRNLVKQQRLAALKNDFISNISHELKTPIATVGVAIEALKNFNALQDPEKTKEYLDISGNEVQRLSMLVDKVLKLSLYENKKIDIQKEAFNLADLAAEVLTSMKFLIEKQNAMVSIKTSGHNLIVEADRLHMTSVIYNLLDNALKYSSSQPKIEINITDHSNFIELQVTDNGIGIALEYRSKVFEKFFRVPGGDRHNIKGYGLGLSYVNHIVQQHQGLIDLQSTPGKGSNFSVKLPFKEAPIIYYDGGRTVRKTSFKIGRS